LATSTSSIVRSQSKQASIWGAYTSPSSALPPYLIASISFSPSSRTRVARYDACGHSHQPLDTFESVRNSIEALYRQHRTRDPCPACWPSRSTSGRLTHLPIGIRPLRHPGGHRACRASAADDHVRVGRVVVDEARAGMRPRLQAARLLVTTTTNLHIREMLLQPIVRDDQRDAAPAVR
jgi:hypothetical protein